MRKQVSKTVDNSETSQPPDQDAASYQRSDGRRATSCRRLTLAADS